MISQIRNSAFSKILWGLMGLYLLNISVDTEDHNPEHIPEDLSINDQESIVEIVVEKILGYENAIEEHDDPDTEDHNMKSNAKIDLTNHYLVEKDLSQSLTEMTKREFPNYNAKLTKGIQKLDIPPPKI